MVSGLLILLRTLGVTNIVDLRKAGVAALQAALADKLSSERAKVTAKALARLVKDGVVARLGTAGPYDDDDGMEMSGNEIFFHDATWAIFRAILAFDGGGRIADMLRDGIVIKHLPGAPALLAGVTDGQTAVDKVMDVLLAELR